MFQSLAVNTPLPALPVNPGAGLELSFDSGVQPNHRIDHLLENIPLGATPGPDSELAQHLSPGISDFYAKAPLNFSSNLRHTLNNLGSDVSETLSNIGDALRDPGSAVNVAMDFAGLTLGINLFRYALGLTGLIDEKSPNFVKAA